MSWDYYRPGPRRAVAGGVVVTKPGQVQHEVAAALVAQAEMEAARAILGRGRTYARAGQVVSVAVAPGEFTAEVQGTDPDPYQVSLRAVTISGADRVAASCDCPYGVEVDWCKHAAALAYVAAHLIDTDSRARGTWLGQQPDHTEVAVPVPYHLLAVLRSAAGLAPPAAAAMLAAAQAVVPLPWAELSRDSAESLEEDVELGVGVAAELESVRKP